MNRGTGGSDGMNRKTRSTTGWPRNAALCLALLLLGTSCGVQNDIAEDIRVSTCPACATAVWLTEENHGDHGEGWGQAECFACHPRVKLHVSSANPYLDLELIRERVDRQGLDACPTCHGRNGT